jgi:hypothetical protein
MGARGPRAGGGRGARPGEEGPPGPTEPLPPPPPPPPPPPATILPPVTTVAAAVAAAAAAAAAAAPALMSVVGARVEPAVGASQDARAAQACVMGEGANAWVGPGTEAVMLRPDGPDSCRAPPGSVNASTHTRKPVMWTRHSHMGSQRRFTNAPRIHPPRSTMQWTKAEHKHKRTNIQPTERGNRSGRGGWEQRAHTNITPTSSAHTSTIVRTNNKLAHTSKLRAHTRGPARTLGQGRGWCQGQGGRHPHNPLPPTRLQPRCREQGAGVGPTAGLWPQGGTLGLGDP